MQVMTTTTQMPAKAGCQRLSIMLPPGQDIGSMSFTKEQRRDAQVAKRLARRPNSSLSSTVKPPQQQLVLKYTESSIKIPQQLDASRSTSSGASLGPPGNSDGRELPTIEDWQDCEIPPELEWVEPDVPEEIRNIVQESIDEHRALRASRLSTTQAIVVRTTITQSRENDEDGTRTTGSTSSASASIRRLNSATSGEMSSALESTTSLSSAGSAAGPSKPPTIYSHIASAGSENDLSGPGGVRPTSRRRPFGGRGVLKFLAHRKGKERHLGYTDAGNSHLSECTSCFDDIPAKKAVPLPCRHKYCPECFVQLIASANESTFPPKCCLQEIPRKTMLAHLSAKDIANFDQKALEYAVPVGNRYYCASPACSRWIDVRKARGSDGQLECPYCKSSVCTLCRGAGHGHDQDCPHDYGLDATLQQAERAGWQRCYNCRAVVELNTGCRHITCKCRAEFCYTCGAEWHTCSCTEVDQQRREAEIRERLDRFEAEAKAEEAEVRAAIAAVEAAERLVVEEREAEEQRLAEEARQITAREYERLEGITDLFEHLRGRLEKVRLQQKQAIQKRHVEDLRNIEKNEEALVYGEQTTNMEQETASEKARLTSRNLENVKAARKKHASQLVETVGRHRQDQDAYLTITNEVLEADPSMDQTAVLEQLLQAQDLERMTLRLMQAREIQKLQARGELILQDYDHRIEIAREERLRTQIQEAEEVKCMKARIEKQIKADWKWFDAIFLDRVMMLGEDERRMILSGTDPPSSPYTFMFE